MTPFRERMNLYRAYRELNPGKNYWDWKQSLEAPAMPDGGEIQSGEVTNDSTQQQPTTLNALRPVPAGLTVVDDSTEKKWIDTWLTSRDSIYNANVRTALLLSPEDSIPTRLQLQSVIANMHNTPSYSFDTVNENMPNYDFTINKGINNIGKAARTSGVAQPEIPQNMQAQIDSARVRMMDYAKANLGKAVKDTLSDEEYAARFAQYKEYSNQHGNLLRDARVQQSATWGEDANLFPSRLRGKSAEDKVASMSYSGLYSPSGDYIAYNNLVRPNNSNNVGLRTHENAHALRDTLPNGDEGGATFKRGISNRVLLRGGLQYDEYLDSDEEIYSRMMDIRARHGLSPDQKVDVKLLEKMRKDGKGDSYFLNRYTNESLIDIMNNYAHNDVMPDVIPGAMQEPVVYAAENGGIIPAMEGGGTPEDYVEPQDYVGPQIDQNALQNAINQLGTDMYIADHTDPYTGVISPFYNKAKNQYESLLIPDVIIRPEYKSMEQMERALNAAAANRGRQYYHDAMRELDAGRTVAELAEWTPVGDMIDLTKAGIAAALGDYLTAGMMAGMMFVPNFIQKPALGYRYLRRKASQKFGAPNVEFYENLVRDVTTRPKLTIQARREGRYPLTFKERRDYMEDGHYHSDRAREIAIQNALNANSLRSALVGKDNRFDNLDATDLIEMSPRFKYSLDGRSYYKHYPKGGLGVHIPYYEMGFRRSDNKTPIHVRLRKKGSNILRHTSFRPNYARDALDYTVGHETTHATQRLMKQQPDLRANVSRFLTNGFSAWERDPTELHADYNGLRSALGGNRFLQLSPEQLDTYVEFLEPMFYDVSGGDIRQALEYMDRNNY